MQVIRSFFIAVALYSRLPAPHFAWREEDMRYTFCFLPWIGAVIGGGVSLWAYLCDVFRIGVLCRAAVGAAIPLLITGGFHADGFMDTMDAIHSYRPRERRLEILRDSHIGAFAVIMLAVYGLLYVGAFSEIREGAALRVVCGGFFLSRCLCGISALSFPLARKEGTLALFADSAQKKAVKGALYLQGAACIALMLYWSLPAGAAATLAAFAAFGYYFDCSRKAFGGVTGDTSGYFILLCEGGIVVAVAVAEVLFL
ncbi:MAG: adenosylcobinamide-GDP ribazoletransferase [Roseburia sp.]|nr:adenosylcobinamide-GDP ribazoletransferase [Roseburia sp.]